MSHKDEIQIDYTKAIKKLQWILKDKKEGVQDWHKYLSHYREKVQEDDDEVVFPGGLDNLHNEQVWFEEEVKHCREADTLVRALEKLIEEFSARVPEEKIVREVGVGTSTSASAHMHGGHRSRPTRGCKEPRHSDSGRGVRGDFAPMENNEGVLLPPPAAECRGAQSAVDNNVGSPRRGQGEGGDPDAVPVACAKRSGPDRPSSADVWRSPKAPGLVLRAPEVREVRMRRAINGDLVVEIPNDEKEDPVTPTNDPLLGFSPEGPFQRACEWE